MAGSCYKNTNPPLSYLIDTVSNFYIDNFDTFYMPVNVRFLTGNSNETVTLFLTGLPPKVTMVSDTIRGVPTFTARFGFWADSAAIGNYPVTLVAYSPSTGYKYYTFNLGVVHSNCSAFLTGNYSGSNTCKSANYTYSVTSTATTDTTINLTNFGGYGVITNTYVKLNCNTDSVTIPYQNIGNGVTISGSGHFTSSQIIVNYIALNTPGGFNDTCTAIFSK